MIIYLYKRTSVYQRQCSYYLIIEVRDTVEVKLAAVPLPDTDGARGRKGQSPASVTRTANKGGADKDPVIIH